MRVIAVHLRQQRIAIITRQHCFHLPRARAGHVHVPYMRDPRMHHDSTQFLVAMNQRAASQPVDPFISVRGAQQRIQGIAALCLAVTARDRQQMQIVVAKDGDRPIAEIAHESQGSQRARAPVDQVTHEPEFIHRLIELDHIQQTSQRVETTLHIADDVDSHQ
jgi:hypothetical protein